MAYWWVNQKQTAEHEIGGGYMWAPLRDKGNKVPHHWEAMTRVQPGDVIFSYVRRAFPAIGVASTAAYDAARPQEFRNQDAWEQQGRRVDVVYTTLNPPIPLDPLLDELRPLLPDRYSPLASDGNGNQGYLFELPAEVGRLLLDRIQAHTTHIDPVVSSIERAPVSSTERTAIVQSRIGQGRFRQGLFALFGGRCCFTGLDVPDLLKASHIKPWSDSNNAERLDPFNGLLLSPAHDALFDSGLMTVDNDGIVRFATAMTTSRLMQLGVERNMRMIVRPENVPYLQHHRAHVFRDSGVAIVWRS